MTDILCYGGKGGVGKTTCAGATGVGLAAAGHRTLVVSTDPAHSLADAFGVEQATGRQQVGTNLWTETVDPDVGEQTVRGIVESLAAEIRSTGLRIDDADVQRLFGAGVVPGSDELAALEVLADHATGTEFDRVVVDTAPTGHTLRLLDLPDVLRETVAAAQSVRGRVRQMVDTARSAVFGPAAFAMRGSDDEDALAAVDERMAAVRDLLRDPDRTAFRVVTVPESMAVAETRRLVERLQEYDLPVRTLVANRVLTEAAADPDCARCRARATSHREQLDAVRTSFPDLDVLELPEVDPATADRDRLDALADRLVG